MSAGALVGPYRLVRPLGSGGYGTVHVAERLADGRRVALKMVHPRGSLSEIRREIEVLSHVGRAGHPGIVEILDEGMHEGTPWYAMELHDGATVDLHVARAVDPSARSLAAAVAGTGSAGNPPRAAGGELSIAMAIVRDLCAALDFLHGEGLVHRDLKPANVVVRRDGRPVLLDLGLVRGTRGPLARAELHVLESVAGTAEYMAPEQWSGDEGDARIDLYALGCLTFELLTGAPPFRGSMHDVMRQHLEAPPPAPSALVAGVPAPLDELVARLLAKDPRARLGHAHDVARWLARLGFGVERPELPPARAHVYRASLAGRGTELEALHAHLRRLARERRGAVVMVEGESGAGKTRLVAEVARRAGHAGLLVLAGACEPAPGGMSEGSSVPLQGLLRPLQAIGDRCRELGPEATAQLLGERQGVLAAVEPSLERLPGGRPGAVPELPPKAARDRLVGSVLETLEALAAVHPIVLVVDDLQWADPLTRAVLAGLGARSGRMALLSILLCRSGERPDGISVEASLPLRGLERDSVRSMVSDMLAVEAPSEAVVDLLERESEGNPLFVAEYVRLLVADRGEEAAGAAAQGRATGIPELVLPRGLHDLIERRLGALPAPEQELLSLASVLGRELDGDLLEAACRELGLVAADGIPLLRARALLEPAGRGRLRFSHDKVREVACGRLEPGSRRELHRAAARALESRSGTAAADVALQGHHWREAGDGARAFACFLAGARAAVPRGALERADALYRSCLELAASPAERATVRSELAQRVLFPRHATAEALAEHARALDEARTAGSVEVEAASLRGMGACHRIMGDLARALVLYGQALERFRACGDRAMEGKMLGVVAGVLTNLGDLDGARDHYDAALAIHREVEDRSAESFTLGNLALLLGESGRAAEALEIAGRSLRLARQGSERVLEMAALMRLALLSLEAGALRDARPQYEAALAICREVGDRQSENVALANLGLVHLDLGNLAAAERLLSESRERLVAAGRRGDEGTALAALGTIALERGEPETARALLEASLALHVASRQRRGHAGVIHQLARCELARGRTDLARRLLAEQIRMARAEQGGVLEASALVELARAARLDGTGEDVDGGLARAAELLQASGSTLALAGCLCEQGHRALDRQGSARAFLERAEAIVHACGAQDGPGARPLHELRAAMERASPAEEPS